MLSPCDIGATYMTRPWFAHFPSFIFRDLCKDVSRSEIMFNFSQLSRHHIIAETEFIRDHLSVCLLQCYCNAEDYEYDVENKTYRAILCS